MITFSLKEPAERGQVNNDSGASSSSIVCRHTYSPSRTFDDEHMQQYVDSRLVDTRVWKYLEKLAPTVERVLKELGLP